MSIVIDNPVTGQRLTLDQFEFNRYMSQTNGAVLKWIVEDDLNKNAGHSDQKEHGSWARGTSAGGIYDHVKESGGITLRLKDGYQPAVGFAFSHIEFSKDMASADFFKSRAFGSKVIADYIKANKKALSRVNNHLGIWYDEDNGKVWLDVSEVHTSQSEATKSGEANSQISIFNLATFETIPIGGTGYKKGVSDGERQISAYPYGQRGRGYDGRRDRRMGREDLGRVTKANTRVIYFDFGLKPVFKHGEGDQKPHGSWANYSSPQSKLIDKMQDLGPTQDDLNSYVDNEFGHNQAPLEDLEFMVRNNQELYDEAIDGIDEEVANKMSDFGFDNPLTRTPEEIEQQRLIEFEQMQDEMIGNYVLNDFDKLQNLLNIENNNFPVNQDQLANSFMDVYNIEHEGVDSDGTAKTLESRINEVYLNGENITVKGDIADENGDFAGEFARRFFKGTNPDTGKETWNVEHEVLKLESEGTGFGKVFIAQSEAYYTAKGMGYIEVGTEWDGARHWARAGYDFDPTKMTSNAEKLAEMRVRIVQGSGTSDLIQSGTLSQNYKAEALAEFDSLMKRTVTDYKVDSSGYAAFNTTKDFKSDDFPIPADFANIGYTKGAKDWVGKQAMYGLNMKYVKVLTAEGQNLLDAPIDRDGDGMIYDGTARERPAPKNN